MAKLAAWTGYTNPFNGTILAWINQAEAANLLAVNSQGVCNAIVTDWLGSFRKYRSDRMQFIAKFTQRDDKGKLLNANIPDEYIAQQAQLSKELAVHRAGYAKRLAQIEGFEKAGDAESATQARLALLLFAKLATGGIDCGQFAMKHSLTDLVGYLKGLKGSGFLRIALTGNIPLKWWEFSDKPFGHVIGLELRPKLKIFHFIDANLGLFLFSTLDELLAFVQQAVWPRFYAQISITKYVIYTYDVGLGGIGLSPEEQAERRRIDQESEAERERERQKLAQDLEDIQKELADMIAGLPNDSKSEEDDGSQLEHKLEEDV